MLLQRLLNLPHAFRRFGQAWRNASQTITKPNIREEQSVDIGKFLVGYKVNGFEVQDVQNINELNVTAVKLLHSKTKAEYLHLHRNDSNNVFAISFRTTPKDSTGLPHILEHTVLCGSHLYPVRDPFFKMLNRSLATFMNAMTGSDFTVYPFSTQNYQDFCNLQKIYLDAVFRPNLNYLDFLQEGWRLENVEPTNIKTDLIIKGVVYNEMKGAFSENQRIFEEKLQNLLLPDHTYGVISGGDPLKIPNLTWNNLKEFHRQCYHPSNAKIFSYGNFPLTPTLKYLDDEYLSKSEYLEPTHTVVPSQKRWSEPKKEHIVGRFENIGEAFEKQNTMALSFVVADVTDAYQTFVLSFLAELLVRGPNSTFHKFLIEPNFCGGFIPSTGYDTQVKDTIFIVGLQGLKKEDFGKVLELFDKAVDDVSKNGFDAKHLESVLHSYEISIKHENDKFGLTLLFGLLSPWNHNGNVMDILKVNKMLDRLRMDIKNDPLFLQKMVDKYIKTNQHRLILTMSPDKEYGNKQDELEKKLINSKTSELTHENRKEIFETNKKLLAEQKKVQNFNILPTLQLQDINNKTEHIPRDKLFIGPVLTQVNKVNTNGLTYFRGVINTSQLSPEQQMLLPLFSNVITKLGTKTMNYKEFDNWAMSKTAGLNVSLHFAESLYTLHMYEPGIILSSYCLDKNIESMWELWTEIFNLSELQDIKRFETLLQLYMSNLSHGVADQGHLYAMLSAASLISGSAYQKDMLQGLQHISYMKTLMKTKRFDSILQELETIAKLLFDKNNLRCSLNTLESNKTSIMKSYEKFIQKLPGNTFGVPNKSAYSIHKVWSPAHDVNCQHHVINVPVNYCSKAVLTTPYTNPDYAKLRVLAKLLTSKYLHPEIREKQGAYGSGAKLNPDGAFTFFSYRDPRNLPTLDVFDASNNWLQDELYKITNQDVLEAKLAVFQEVDAPIPPCNKGMKEFLMGLTPDVLQRFRAEIISVNQEGLSKVSEKYLMKATTKSISKVILGPKAENLKVNSRTGELWTVIEMETM